MTLAGAGAVEGTGTGTGRRYRLGLLGASRISEKAVLQPLCQRSTDVSTSLGERLELLAVGASSADKAASFAAAHQLPRAYGSYQALLDDPDIDVIYNALPPSLHAQWSIKALQAGKAVLCEKPFARNQHEASAMVGAAVQSGQLLLEAYHYRFHPLFARVQQLLQSGVLGTVHTVRSHFLVRIDETPGSLRHNVALGGGALMDLGCYPLHWTRQLFGDDFSIDWADAICDRPELDQSFAARLVYNQGPQVFIGASMAPHLGRKHQADLTLEGSLGTLEVQNLVAPQQGHQLQLHLAADGPQTQQLTAESTYFYQLKHLLDCLDGQALPLTGGPDALAQMQAIDALYRRAGLSPR